MKAAMPVPYIIAILIGVVVLSLLGYWFLSQGSSTLGGGSQAQCESLCASWRVSAFNLKPLGIENKCKDHLTGFAPAIPPSPVTNQDITLNKCMKLLGCSFKPSCSSIETNYGTNSAGSVCCS